MKTPIALSLIRIKGEMDIEILPNDLDRSRHIGNPKTKKKEAPIIVKLLRFCRKVYLLGLGFFIFQMPHKSNLSLSSLNLAINFFSRVGLSPYESRDIS